MALKKTPSSGRNLTRASQLWLLVSILFAIAPHANFQPIWVSLLVIIIWAWRTYLAWYQRPQPGRILVTVLAIASVFLILATYGTLFGREAGVVLLEVMLIMKLMEMRTLRDAMIAVFLGFFVVLTHFLHSQTLFVGAYVLSVIWLFIFTLIALNRRDGPTFSEIGKTATTLFVQSIPLMLVLFVFVPRVPGPLWGIPKDNSRATSGLTEEMSPGSIGDLALSDAIAFRVEFDDKIPSIRNLYWRAIVMNHFDGKTWRVAYGGPPPTPAAFQTNDAAISYKVTLEPHNQRWLPILDIPQEIPSDARLTNTYQLLSVRPTTARIRYEASSYLRYRLGAEATSEELLASLQLPAGNARAIALAESFKTQNAKPQEIIARALKFFTTQEFVYTLTPPILPKDPIDSFLFESKAGFCEHYAGAFTFLMRAAGIPARIVTGYQGGEINPIGNYLIVRQAEAHAWTEIWLAERGWVRIDPTAVVSPTRVDAGIRAALPARDVLPSLITPEQAEWLHSFRLSWDAVNNQWNQWVLGYNFEQQKRLMRQWGKKDANWQDLTIAMMIAAAVVIFALFIYLLVRRNRLRQDPVLAIYTRFCKRLQQLGITINPNEGPVNLATRAAAALPEFATAIQEITQAYVTLRYRKESHITLKDLQHLVARFPDKNFQK